MLTTTDIIKTIYQKVRTEGELIPRDYQTIGGMWTVDTWILGNVKVQMMDEGYTHIVIWKDLRVVSTYNKPPTFTQGDDKVLDYLARILGIIR